MAPTKKSGSKTSDVSSPDVVTPSPEQQNSSPLDKAKSAVEKAFSGESKKKPSVGRIVHYILTQDDVDTIDRRRGTSLGFMGGPVYAGDVCPAIITKVTPVGVALQVFLDGNDQLWKDYPPEGNGRGCWFWPPFV